MKARLVAGLVSSLAIATAAAQQPPQPPAKPDTPEIKALIEQTRKAAGPKFAYAVHFWCEEPRANRADDPAIEGPARMKAKARMKLVVRI